MILSVTPHKDQIDNSTSPHNQKGSIRLSDKEMNENVTIGFFKNAKKIRKRQKRCIAEWDLELDAIKDEFNRRANANDDLNDKLAKEQAKNKMLTSKLNERDREINDLRLQTNERIKSQIYEFLDTEVKSNDTLCKSCRENWRYGIEATLNCSKELKEN